MAPTVTIGVFGLFHPTELTVREGSRLTRFTLSTGEKHLAGLADFTLSVPGKIDRRYHGRLTIQPVEGELLAIVELDRDVATASIVAAESPPGAKLEALKAQATLARSFLAASPARHRHFQFCDTTHCQFLRECPRPGSLAHRATRETQGLMLTSGGQTIAPLYSAACGGRTLDSYESGYHYRSVACEYCLRHAREPVRGHRLGLCQQGAADMARAGATFRQILDHYYPGTAVASSIY